MWFFKYKSDLMRTLKTTNEAIAYIMKDLRFHNINPHKIRIRIGS